MQKFILLQSYNINLTSGITFFKLQKEVIGLKMNKQLTTLKTNIIKNSILSEAI